MRFDLIISLIGLSSKDKSAILCTEKVTAALFKIARKISFNTSIIEHYIPIKSRKSI